MELDLMVATAGRHLPVSVEAAPQTTVGELAEALAGAVRAGPAGPLYLGTGALAPDLVLEESPIVTGALVGLGAPAPDPSGTPAPLLDGAPAEPPTAAPASHPPASHPLEVAVVGGLDAGGSVAAPAGARLGIGRGVSAEVLVDDGEVSRVHAVLRVEGPEGAVLADAGSRNGTRWGGYRLQGEARLAPGDAFQVGETVLALRRRQPTEQRLERDGRTGRLGYNRPPRIIPATAPPEADVPAAPKPPERRRFSLLTVLLPVLLIGAVLLVLRGRGGQGNSAYLLLFALSPVLLVGQLLGDQLGARREHRRRQAGHRRAMAGLDERLAALVAAEERAARDAAPDPAAVAAIATGPTGRLWERRPDDQDFLHLRLGLADRPAEVRLRGEGAGEYQAPLARLVPVTVDLPAAGVLGVAAPRPAALRMARALLAQAATLHAPRDLALVVLTGRDQAADWDWCGWLPHTQPDASWQARRTVAADARQGEARLAELRRLIEERLQEQRASLRAGGFMGPHVLVVLDGAKRLRGLRGLAEVLRDGPGVGVDALCVDADEASLPDECGATAVASPASGGRLVVSPPGGAAVEGVVPDGLGAGPAERVARALAPVRLLGHERAGAGQLPDAVRLLELHGNPEITPESLRAGWAASPQGRSTKALLGIGPDGPVAVDLRRDGPHALVAGTTGAGKSELLQTLVAGLALGNAPDGLNFVLVDYKGGSAFKECADLPHCVGLVTDLDSHLVDRALASLGAEVKRREELFAAVGARDLDDYWARCGDRLPRLVIVVDEFASLIEEVPEFVKGVVGIGMRGRSLGVHVVLATQRPAGVVTAEIRANVNLRICLRVTSAVESSDVIDSPEAARIPKGHPGRAWVRTGHGELAPFQAARVAWPLAERTGEAAVTAWPRRFTDLGSPAPAAAAAGERGGPTDLSLLVRAAREAAETLGVAAPSSPWLPPLPELVALDTLAEAGAAGSGAPGAAEAAAATGASQASAPAQDPPAAVIGLGDRPHQQAQVPFALDLDRTGSVLVAGAVRSGRSTALRTIAAALAAATSPADLHLYALDCGNQALAALAALPHTGAVVDGEDTSRVERLLGFLGAEVAVRQRLLAQSGFGSLAEQRAAEPAAALPRVVVLLDRMETFHARYLDVDGGRLLDQLEHLLRHGPAVGITFVIAGDRTGVTHRLASALESRLVLRMADRDDYASFGLDPRKVPVGMPAGRGLWLGTGEEVQVAVASGDAAGASQAEALRALGAESVRRWQVPAARLPRRVDPIPEHIALAELEALRAAPKPDSAAACVVAAGGDQLGPVDLDLAELGGCFVVAGPPRSGRSTALATIVGSLRGRECGDLPVLLVTPRPSPLRDLADLDGVVDLVDDPANLKEALSQHHGPLAVVVDDAELLADGATAVQLDQVVRAARDGHAVLVAAATTQDLLLARYRGWLADARRSRNGLLLNPTSHLDGEVFDVRLSRSVAGHWPAGRAVLVRRGVTELVQVPQP